MTNGVEGGPLLAEILMAQRSDEESTVYPRIATLGTALVNLVRELDDPAVWPVGAAAERLIGAATVLARGELTPCGWTLPPKNQRVLLVTVNAVTPLALLAAAHQARRGGATEIHACGVSVAGSELLEEASVDSFRPLESTIHRSMEAVLSDGRGRQ